MVANDVEIYEGNSAIRDAVDAGQVSLGLANHYYWYEKAAEVGADITHQAPGNRLEALSGDRQGQHSIRINQQWRVCFRWSDGGCDDVEICDYH